MRVWLTVLLALGQLAGAQVPQAAIANARIRATLYMPDARSGYYRGTRFDWSGVVANLEWKGHTYFGQWFPRYDPTLHDSITGPVEEYRTGDSALNYGLPGGVRGDEDRAGPGRWSPAAGRSRRSTAALRR